MFGFFEQIANIIGFVIDFVISAFTMLLTLITQIPAALVFIAASVVYLPEFLTTFVLLFIGTAVVLQIINKGD